MSAGNDLFMLLDTLGSIAVTVSQNDLYGIHDEYLNIEAETIIKVLDYNCSSDQDQQNHIKCN